jgi:hypothetical protein
MGTVLRRSCHGLHIGARKGCTAPWAILSSIVSLLYTRLLRRPLTEYSHPPSRNNCFLDISWSPRGRFVVLSNMWSITKSKFQFWYLNFDADNSLQGRVERRAGYWRPANRCRRPPWRDGVASRGQRHRVEPRGNAILSHAMSHPLTTDFLQLEMAMPSTFRKSTY